MSYWGTKAKFGARTPFQVSLAGAPDLAMSWLYGDDATAAWMDYRRFWWILGIEPGGAFPYLIFSNIIYIYTVFPLQPGMLRWEGKTYFWDELKHGKTTNHSSIRFGVLAANHFGVATFKLTPWERCENAFRVLTSCPSSLRTTAWIAWWKRGNRPFPRSSGPRRFSQVLFAIGYINHWEKREGNGLWKTVWFVCKPARRWVDGWIEGSRDG